MTSFVTANPVFDPASPQAHALLNLLNITLIVCAVILVIVIVYIGWCMIRFRARAGETREPIQIAGNSKLELSWTLASVLVLIILFMFMLKAMRISDPTPLREPDLIVVGHQWWWEIRYPDGMVTANEIHIPVNKDILVRLDAADVIHSFWVPRLGRKMDAIPGHPNYMWIRADKMGNYIGACSEFCGAQHAWMRILVTAENTETFDAWRAHQLLPAQAVTTPSASRGRKIFLEKTCVSCHSIRGIGPSTVAAPDLTHFASRKTIGAGVSLNNPAALRRWLANPQAVKPGCLMPDFRLLYPEVDNLANFLETLE